jgi:predicted metal-dependent peptidase/intein/homing endonuclease
MIPEISQMTAEDRIRKVRIQFLREKPFFAHLSLYLNLIERKDFDTMGVDFEGGLIYNPKFVNSFNFTDLKMIIAHETCLVPETFVWNKKINEIKVGDKILGDDGKEHKVILTNERKYEGELICITPRGSLPIKITPNHPVLTTNGLWKGFQKPNYRKLKNRVGENKFIFEKLKWKNADELTENDWLVIPKIKPLEKYENYVIKFSYGNVWSTTLKKSIREGLKLDEDIAYFLGLYTADGWANIKSKTIGICLHSKKDIEKIEKIKKIIENKMGFKVNIKKRTDSNCFDVKFSSRPFVSFLHENIGTRAWNKKIPEFIIFNNDEIKKAFLKGFIDGDGYNNHINIGFATTSENLAHQLFMLSASLGIIFNMYKERRNTKKGLSRLNKINKEWTDIYIFFSRCHKIFDVLNLPHKERTIRKTTWFKEYEDYILIKIRKIQREKYDGLVFNLQTENQNYISNNIVVHNCHLAFLHLTRRGNRIPLLWNIAVDLAVNNILHDDGFHIPEGFLMNRKYKDMTAEQIYDDLYKNAKHIKMRIGGICKKCSDGTQEVDFNDTQGKMFDKHSFPKRQDNGAGRKNSKGSEKNGKESEKDKDDDTKGEPLSDDELKKLQDLWKKRIVEAETIAKQMGKLPANLERMFGNLLDSRINWKALLYRYITQEIPYDSTYARPSKKSESVGVYLPYQVKENIEIIIGVDSSGSITQEELTEFMSEMVAIAKSFSSIRMSVIVCDSEIHETYEVMNGFSPTDIKISGGGGTDFRPVFKWIEKNKPSAKLLVYFTDGYGSYPANETVKTLWVLKENYDVPFGEKVIYKGSD